jgi:predicted metal-dependent phosphotriesterase family hydrolase
MTFSDQFSALYPVITVQGPLPYEHLGITDAHNHMWIEPIAGADPGAPVLNQFNAILQECSSTARRVAKQYWIVSQKGVVGMGTSY